MTDETVSEYDVLRRLERRVRKMFKYTGWDIDRDADAATCVRAVEQAIDDLDVFRRIKRKSGA